MKTLVVTGVSKGLGHVIAQTFLSAGWHVIGTGRSDRPESLDGQVQYAQFDASDSSACANFWQQIKDDLQGAEVCLVNNAGGYIGGDLHEAQAEDFETQMRQNYFTGVHMTQGLVKTVPAAKIINIISNNANSLSPGSSAYGASKAAAKQFFQSVRKEAGNKDYRISNIYPDNIATSGPDPNAIDPIDLANLVLQMAESTASYYIPEVTLYTVKRS